VVVLSCRPGATRFTTVVIVGKVHVGQLLPFDSNRTDLYFFKTIFQEDFGFMGLVVMWCGGAATSTWCHPVHNNGYHW
jgi:hypothetical protein